MGFGQKGKKFENEKFKNKKRYVKFKQCVEHYSTNVLKNKMLNWKGEMKNFKTIEIIWEYYTDVKERKEITVNYHVLAINNKIEFSTKDIDEARQWINETYEDLNPEKIDWNKNKKDDDNKKVFQSLEETEKFVMHYDHLIKKHIDSYQFEDMVAYRMHKMKSIKDLIKILEYEEYHIKIFQYLDSTEFKLVYSAPYSDVELVKKDLETLNIISTNIHSWKLFNNDDLVLYINNQTKWNGEPIFK